jgi:hypothetical protein
MHMLLIRTVILETLKGLKLMIYLILLHLLMNLVKFISKNQMLKSCSKAGNLMNSSKSNSILIQIVTREQID